MIDDMSIPVTNEPPDEGAKPAQHHPADTVLAERRRKDAERQRRRRAKLRVSRDTLIASRDASRDGLAPSFLKKKDLVGGDGNARAREAWKLADEIAIIAGHSLDFLPPQWVSDGPGERVKLWLASGWSREIIVAVCKDVVANKRDGPPATIRYFEKPIARQHARNAEPLPAIETTGAVNVGDDQRKLTLLRPIARGEGRPGGAGFGFSAAAAHFRARAKGSV